MLFSSTVFIFIFLPIVLGIHFLLPKTYRNTFILLTSLFFYAWGEYTLVLLMIASIIINYFLALQITKNKNKVKLTKVILIIGLIINLSSLAYYKYANFLMDNLSNIGINFTFDTSNIVLPIGISFFTFQSISYLIDVYRKTTTAQTNILKLGMYISLFPQLIAGPIVRYIDIEKEISNRRIDVTLFTTGITRFITGFAKKIIIANNVGFIADKIFEVENNNLSTPLAWIGIICYTLQIYYDFSGYSDMAIGLGKMLGFNFKENFNYPYIAKSITDFWRRWHISLSTWFKDYLYIPLGGNRKGKYRTYINLFIVFLLTGLWHGASWNFVVWGLFHGVFLIVEKINPLKLNIKLAFIKRLYLLLVVMVGWVLFRTENLNDAFYYIKSMFSYTPTNYNYPYVYLNAYNIIIILLGIIFSAPIHKRLSQLIEYNTTKYKLLKPLQYILYIILFGISIMELAQTTYNPFIYFRF